MTSVYDEDGVAVPVTVIEAGPCVVVQRKDNEKDGYAAVQLGFENQKEQRLNKPDLGHFKKAGVDAKRVLKEFRIQEATEVAVGDVIEAINALTNGVEARLSPAGDGLQVVNTATGAGTFSIRDSGTGTAAKW